MGQTWDTLCDIGTLFVGQCDTFNGTVDTFSRTLLVGHFLFHSEILFVPHREIFVGVRQSGILTL